MPRLGPWLAGLILAALPLTAVAGSENADPWIESHLTEMVGLYQHFHGHPELSNREVETSARIADELRRAGVEVTTGVGVRGVVGVLRNGRGPTVLVRADMDALPVTEATGLPYASTVM